MAGDWTQGLQPAPEKNIVTKSKEAMAGMSEIRQPVNRFNDLRIGSWNVFSLYRSKSLQMLLDMEDARKLGERNWRNAVRNRDNW